MSFDITITTAAKSTCGHCGTEFLEKTVLDWSPTYNLSAMFREAFGGRGIREFNGLKASDCVERLRKGLADMRARPSHYQQFDAENGWGTYCDDLLQCIERMLMTCEENPDATVEVT